MSELKILGLQLVVDLDCTSTDEYLIETMEFKEQMQEVKKLISTKNPDIVILPEMCYSEDYYEYFIDRKSVV